jgi:hypothetical protein
MWARSPRGPCARWPRQSPACSSRPVWPSEPVPYIRGRNRWPEVSRLSISTDVQNGFFLDARVCVLGKKTYGSYGPVVHSLRLLQKIPISLLPMQYPVNELRVDNGLSRFYPSDSR